MIRRKRRKVTNKTFLFLGVVFLSVGVFASYITAGSMVLGYMNASGWSQVPVQIEALEYKAKRGENTTYTVTAKYSYVVDGGDYSSTSVAISTGYDNVGTFWYDLYHKLDRQKSKGTAYAWVDLDNPQNALLDRSFRWQMVAFGGIFLIMFGMFGFALTWLAFLPEKNKQQIKDEARAGLKSNEAEAYKFIFYFGLVFLLVGLAFTGLALPEVLTGRNIAAALVLVFPAVGGFLIRVSRRAKHTYQLIGPTFLLPDPVMGSIGGQAGGKFKINSRTDGNPVKIHLSCKETHGSGQHRHTSIVWQDTMTAYVKPIPDGSWVHFVFDVPGHLPEAGKRGKNRTVSWDVSCDAQLDIDGEIVTLNRTWMMPMEKSTRTSRAMAHVPENFIKETQQTELEMAQASAGHQIKIEDLGGNISITSRAGRNIGVLGIFAGIGLLFAGVGVFTFASWFGAYIFLVIGSFFVISSIFAMGRRLNVLVNRTDKMIFMGRSWFGVPLYMRRLAYSDPAEFSVQKTSSSSKGNIQTDYYAIYAEREGRKIKLAESVAGKDAAEALLVSIRAKIFD